MIIKNFVCFYDILHKKLIKIGSRRPIICRNIEKVFYYIGQMK